MISLNVTVPVNYRPVSLAALMDVFTSVNRFSAEEGRTPIFTIRQFQIGENGIELVSPLLESPVEDPDNPLNGTLLPSNKTDFVLIPAFRYADMARTLEQNKPWIPWLRSHYNKGAGIASFCTGAFLLAATGLLSGKCATTHLMYMDAFRKRFPEVNIREDAVVTDDSGTYTSGGATSSFHLMLYLIEKYCNREMSLRIARMFAIDPDRVSQSYFGEFKPVINRQDSLVRDLQKLIEKRYNEDISISDLADTLPASRRTLYRRFKEATGLTPFKYLQKIRIEAAKRLLEQTHQNVSEVMYNCGYSDPKSFRNLFRDNVGLTPGHYRKKYQPLNGII